MDRALRVKLFELLNSPTWDESRRFVESHPELLGDASAALLREFSASAEHSGDSAAARQFEFHRLLLRRCRQVGVDAAFTELTSGPSPTAIKLQLAISALAHASTPSEQRRIIEDHPELLGPAAQSLLDELDSSRASDRSFAEAMLRVRHLLHACRRLGVSTALDFASGNAGEIAPALRELYQRAFAVSERYERSRERAALEEAEPAWLALLAHEAFSTAVAEFRRTGLSGAGTTYVERYRFTGELEDLDRGIGLLLRALDAGDAGLPLAHTTMERLGTAYLLRFSRTGARADFNAATDVLEQAAATAPRDLPDVSRYHALLGSVFMDAYERGGAISDLNAAVDAAERAVELTRPDSEDRSPRLGLLGTALNRKYERVGDVAALEAAIRAHETAAELAPGDPVTINWLAMALARRHGEYGALADLDRAIEGFEQALRQHPEPAAVLTNLGNALHARYQVTGHASDLNAAIEALEQGVEATPSDSPDISNRLGNLANGLRARFELDGSPTDLVRAIDAYRRGCSEPDESAPLTDLNMAQRWARWAAERDSWPEAADAYKSALSATRRLFRLRLGRPAGELWLVTASAVPSEAAYALAKAGDMEGAALAVDRARALVLSETLARDRADLEHLAQQGHEHLRDRYRRAAEHLSSVEHGQSAAGAEYGSVRIARAQDRRRARDALDAVEAEIRSIDGFADFLAEPELADITVQGPVAYVMATRRGGLALIVGSDESVTPIWLPDLKQDAVDDSVVALIAAADVTDHLDEVTAWLWSSVMGPVLDAHEHDRLTLVPVGHLGLLPLHAAWTQDPETPTGRTYALDRVQLRYAPNAAILAASGQRAARAGAEQLVAVFDSETLTYAREEVQAAAEHFAHVTKLDGRVATAAEVLDACAGGSVLHFACHGRANLGDPLSSRLELRSGENLTLRRIVQQRLPRCRLAVLSACETAVVGAEVPDEVIGMASGFLEAGAAGVVGSMWMVPDLGTRLLMARFYELWRVSGLEPAEALRRAQQWVRDATPDSELASPSHWAAFVYVGI
jgi:tetratricopeptide (TPR) repeat protein